MEVIVCSKCKGEDCRVEELVQREKVSMEEYARRNRFPNDLYSQFLKKDRTIRRFIITCQDCGHQLEYSETVDPPPVIRFAEDPPPQVRWKEDPF